MSKNAERSSWQSSRVDTSVPVAAAFAGVELKKVGLLDAPMVFGLMLDGCLSGAFSDRYLRDAGHFKLFVYVMKSVLIRPRWMSRGPVMVQTYLLCSKGREVGFIQLDSSASTAEITVSTIALVAIAKADQNQGIGTQTVSALIVALPQNAILEAYCTKYARSMQHVLAKLHFSRDKSTIDNLTRFSYRKL